MNEMVFSWAQAPNGRMVHVDDVPNGLKCNCICPNCKERLQARHGAIRAHGFAHHSETRGANLKICYMVILYKLAEQIIQQERKIHAPSYYGIFKEKDIEFVDVKIDSQYEREDKQPDVIATTVDGQQYLIEFTFDYKIQHKEKIDYQNLNCLEVNLSNQTLESLHDFLMSSSDDRKWLNNQQYFESIESIYEQYDKVVKVISEKDCRLCELRSRCCGIRLKGTSDPIIIENSGGTYRVCKTNEFDQSKLRLEDEVRERERQRIFAREQELKRKEQERINALAAEERRKEVSQQEEYATSQIRPEDRTCFLCRCNLDWMCRNNGFAHCGPYSSMRVPKNTPPDTAKTCRGFRAKVK